MIITDDAKAAVCLERIGYYRLSGYWYPFRKAIQGTDASGKVTMQVLDDFIPGIQLNQVHDLYVFDKRLRMLALDAIERVEVGLRVDIALHLGKRNAWAHRTNAELHPDFAVKLNKRGVTGHSEWLNRLDELAERAKNEEFVSHFRSNYSSDLPIWIAIELWDFGVLSFFLSGMKHADLMVLAQKYGIPKYDLLKSWVRSINHIRNICAHHSRLWNRPPADQPRRPRVGEVPLLNHVASNAPQPLSNPHAPTRIYMTLAVIQFFMRTINPTSSWAQRLKDLIAEFPQINGVGISQMGFPPKWDSLPLWN
jgi:abortive infection bacteriophage resistance protein